jgi:hypothetical protein
MFYLALTFGLEHDPPDAVARAVGFVEACGRARGVQYPFEGTIATTDGESLWAFRDSSQGTSRSLFFTRNVRAFREQYPDREILREVSDDARPVVSEPVGDPPGAWVEMPEASYGVVSKEGGQLKGQRPWTSLIGCPGSGIICRLWCSPTCSLYAVMPSAIRCGPRIRWNSGDTSQ